MSDLTFAERLHTNSLVTTVVNNVLPTLPSESFVYLDSTLIYSMYTVTMPKLLHSILTSSRRNRRQSKRSTTSAARAHQGQLLEAQQVGWRHATSAASAPATAELWFK